MKKLDKNIKYMLIKVLAALIVLQSSISLRSDNKSNNTNDLDNKLVVDIIIDNVINSMNYKALNVSRLSNNHVIVNYDKALSYISFNGSNIFINTSYQDGFKEKDILNLNTIDIYDLSFRERHVVSETTNKNPLFYDENGNVNNLGKENLIMEVFGITQQELDFVLAGPMAEGIENNYVDVSAAMRTGINRLFSYAWLGHAIDRLELNCDYKDVTIYDIFRDPYQFAVYYPTNKPPRYERFLGIKSGEGYQGALDTLYYSIFDSQIPEELIDKIVIHDYLEFQDVNDPIPGSYSYEQFVSDGNKHYRHQKETDRVVSEDSILYYYFNKDNSVMTLSK